MITLTLPDLKELFFDTHPIGFEVAQKISPHLKSKSVAIKVNGKLQDLSSSIRESGKVELITSEKEESLKILRHSAAHILAQALLRIFPKTKLTIGPPTDFGFFYDVENDELKEEDLPKIEEEMRKIRDENLEIKRCLKSYEEAMEFFKDNLYKQEIIEAIKNKTLRENETEEGGLQNGSLSFYMQGEFIDMCSGPHMPQTGKIKFFKLDKITKSYWRGNSKNRQLTRIYGTAFFKEGEMKNYYEMLEEAKRRDHKKLAKKMKLYTISEEVGAGLPLFQPKGMVLRREIENFLWELHKKKNYMKVWTPHIAKVDLYKTSGHYSLYKENFKVLGKGGEEFILKPMNCPHHMKLFADNYLTYREMPIKYFEPATVYRDELSGTLTGLTRVRCITQDDGHLFCMPSQIKEEINSIIDIIWDFYGVLGMLEGYFVSLSVRDKNRKEDYLGKDSIWERAEKELEEIAKARNLNYRRVEGEAAFYGPKLDFMFRDSLKREHQLATIQLDFNLSDRFNLYYINKDGKKERPVVIHRAISGSFERSLAILTEHFEGKFPLWLSPTQIVVINVLEKHILYCKKIKEELEGNDFRVESLFGSESVGKKIAMARENLKPNYTLVIGDREVREGCVSIRTRKFENRKNEEFSQDLKKFKERLEKERKSREIYP